MTSLLTLIFKWIGISNDLLFKDVQLLFKKREEKEEKRDLTLISLPPSFCFE